MRIVADANIPFVRECLSSVGEVRVLGGRDITPQVVADADALLVRSITPVNEQLLGGSAVRFVGTATIGFDHVDVAYLQRSGVGFASAPGSNANSAAEYVIAGLLEVGRRRKLSLEGKSIGVIGVGNVGGRVARKCEALGMRVLRNDPPLQRRTGDPKYVPAGGSVRLRLHHDPHAADAGGDRQDVPSGGRRVLRPPQAGSGLRERVAGGGGGVRGPQGRDPRRPIAGGGARRLGGRAQHRCGASGHGRSRDAAHRGLLLRRQGRGNDHDLPVALRALQADAEVRCEGFSARAGSPATGDRDRRRERRGVARPRRGADLQHRRGRPEHPADRGSAA